MTLPQRFVINQLDEAAFNTRGLRDYSAYRDLGVAEVTRGLAHAHVIRMIVPFGSNSVSGIITTYSSRWSTA